MLSIHSRAFLSVDVKPGLSAPVPTFRNSNPNPKGVLMAKKKSSRPTSIDYAWLHLTVDPELKAVLKERALIEGSTQTALVIRALEEYLTEGKS